MTRRRTERARRRHDAARRIGQDITTQAQYGRMIAQADTLLHKRNLDIRSYPGDPLELFRLSSQHRARLAIIAAARYLARNPASQTARYMIDIILANSK